MKKIYLLDGSALIYRSYYAFLKANLRTMTGQPTGAIYGFARYMLNFLSKEKPEFIAVAFDRKEKTFRKEQYELYKANRKPMPDELVAQLDGIKRFTQLMGIPVLEIPGYEADDIMGTVAENLPTEYQLVLLTSDKDIFQLVKDGCVEIYDPAKEIWIHEKEVVEKFQVSPNQVPDVLGLMGDSSDNIPGVPGIGPKRAGALVQKYGSLETVIQNAPQERLKAVKAIADYADQAYLSRQLATIERNVPMEFTWNTWKMRVPDLQKMVHFLQDYNMQSLLSLLPAAPEEELFATESSLQQNYHLINDAQDFAAFMEKLWNQESFAFDTETTSLDCMEARLVGMSFCWQEGEAYYIPLRHDYGQELDADVVLEALRPVMADPRKKKIAHNGKYDWHVLKNERIPLKGFVFDTMIAAHLLVPNRNRNGLDYLAMEFFQYQMQPIEDLIGKGKNQRSFNTVDVQVAAHYAAEDADFTFRLYGYLRQQLDERTFNLLEKVEMPLLDVLNQMERNGVKIDDVVFRNLALELDQAVGQLQETIFELADATFNINSTKQLAEILFDKMQLPTVKKTKTGYSTNVDVLTKLADDGHEIARHLLEYRSLTKLKSTYIDTLPTLTNSRTLRLHTHFNQTATATGRLSSSDPNLQNIPVRTDWGKRIRAGFIGSGTHQLLAADYSQIELRLLAALSGDENMCAAFQSGADIHRETAARIFQISPDMVTSDMRRKAKEVNFSVIYGVTPFGLSRNIGISLKEAKFFIDQYYVNYPKIRDYFESILAFARQHEYVETFYGRKRPLPDIHSSNRVNREMAERMAVNSVIQGTAAGLIKRAMIALQKALTESPVQIILQIHDELLLEGEQADLEHELPNVKAIMENVMPPELAANVPLLVDIRIAKNWYEAH